MTDTLRAPLDVAVLCSRRAPGLTWLLNQDPNRGRLYRIVCCVTTEETFDEEVRVERRGVPCVSRAIRPFYEGRNRPLRDLDLRRAYDADTVQVLRRFSPDLVILSGYLYVVTDPMLSAFRHRILNAHHSDLTLRGPDDSTRYPGLRAVRDAVLAGEPETRSTMHLVTPEVDEGPAIVRSWSFPVSPLVACARRAGDLRTLSAYAFAHENWMLGAGWGPLLAAAIELVATGRVDLDQLARGATAAPWDVTVGGELLPPRAPSVEDRGWAEMLSG
jgi:folate-dependent phosphoribosylglycinamide formyltransferase PurN